MLALNSEIRLPLPRTKGMHSWPLNAQHSGSRGKQISEFEASLVYRARAREAPFAEKHCLEKTKYYFFMC